MANNKKVIKISSTQKHREEELAAKKAAELALKRKRFIMIGVISAVVITAIVLMAVLIPRSSGGTSATISTDVQTVTTSSGSSGSGNITVKAGVPVSWTINASQSLGCMTGVKQSTLGINKTLSSGTANTVRFTPTKKGTFTVTCPSGHFFCRITVN
ncbi:MAG: cupredoxin domain-containing protein [Clostridiaceae bacterium]|jgi:plastocyanin domain-containing protein|nr:cupredoxin domain-containing protein [Clostridiaceae bacterium]